MTEIFGVWDKAIYTALTGNSNLNTLVGGRIFDTQAPLAENGLPADGMYPLIIFQHTSAGDQNDSPLRDLQPVYRVECVALVQADARLGQGYIDDALHNKILTMTGGFTNWMTTSMALLNLIENFQGKQYYRKGAFYKIAADL